MVYGLEKFRDYFGDYTNQYVFIGGTACEILLGELGVSFRATKDLDFVLIIEVLEASFVHKFWKFIEDGGYKHREKSTGLHQFYRFSSPTKSGFPVMVELFSRKPYNFDLKFGSGLTPIYIEEGMVSLSAILLNDYYYEALLKSKRKVDGYSVIEIETMILFKIKAWLDLKEKLDRGEHVDSKNIRKHKNDVFRLLANVLPSSKVEINDEAKVDIRQFIKRIEEDKPDMKNLGLGNITLNEMIRLLENIFVIVD